jgi:hypothetical protein
MLVFLPSTLLTQLCSKSDWKKVFLIVLVRSFWSDGMHAWMGSRLFFIITNRTGRQMTW